MLSLTLIVLFSLSKQIYASNVTISTSFQCYNSFGTSYLANSNSSIASCLSATNSSCTTSVVKYSYGFWYHSSEAKCGTSEECTNYSAVSSDYSTFSYCCANSLCNNFIIPLLQSGAKLCEDPNRVVDSSQRIVSLLNNSTSVTRCYSCPFCFLNQVGSIVKCNNTPGNINICEFTFYNYNGLYSGWMGGCKTLNTTSGFYSFSNTQYSYKTFACQNGDLCNNPKNFQNVANYMLCEDGFYDTSSTSQQTTKDSSTTSSLPTTKQTTKSPLVTTLPTKTTTSAAVKQFQCYDYIYFGTNNTNFFGNANAVPTIRNCGNTNFCMAAKFNSDQSVQTVFSYSSYAAAGCGESKLPIANSNGYQYALNPRFGSQLISFCSTPLCNSPQLVEQLYKSNMKCENNLTTKNKKLIFAKPTNRTLIISAVKRCYFCSENSPCSMTNTGRVQTCDLNPNSPNYGNACSYGFQYISSNNSMAWIGGCNSTQSVTFESINLSIGKLIRKMVYCFSDLCNNQNFMKPLRTAFLCQDGFYN